MKKFASICFSFILCLSCFLLCSCSSSKEEYIEGTWQGSNIENLETTITCEEYETNAGEFLGKKNGSSFYAYYVNNEKKDLIQKNLILVDSENQYIGDNYTVYYNLLDKITNELLYHSDEVRYSYKAVYKNDTNEYLGEYTYCDGSYYPNYTVNGKTYKSSDVTIRSVYFSLSDDEIIGFSDDFIKQEFYNIGGVIYPENEIQTIYNGFLDNKTKTCYQQNQVIQKSVYSFGKNNIIMPIDEVKQIYRKCFGSRIFSEKITFGNGYAQLEIEINKTYDYSGIADYTFQSIDTSESVYFKGYFSKLENTIYFDSNLVSYDKGNNWYSLGKSKEIFEIKIDDKELSSRNISFHDTTNHWGNYTSDYEEVILKRN